MKKSEELQAQLDKLEADMEKERTELFASAKREYGDDVEACDKAWNKAWEEWWRGRGKFLSERKSALQSEVIKEKRREVEVGDGVTVCQYSDRHAYTVIKRTKESITIQRDKVTRDPKFTPEWVPGGFSAICVNQNEQEWLYERDEQGEVLVCRWSEKNGWFQHNGCKIINGRHEFYDYNF